MEKDDREKRNMIIRLDWKKYAIQFGERIQKKKYIFFFIIFSLLFSSLLNAKNIQNINKNAFSFSLLMEKNEENVHFWSYKNHFT